VLQRRPRDPHSFSSAESHAPIQPASDARHLAVSVARSAASMNESAQAVLEHLAAVSREVEESAARGLERTRLLGMH
jgi:hypothetical protein